MAEILFENFSLGDLRRMRVLVLLREIWMRRGTGLRRVVRRAANLQAAGSVLPIWLDFTWCNSSPCFFRTVGIQFLYSENNIAGVKPMEQYIQPFVKVCTEVFKQFVGYDLATSRPFFLEREAVNEWDVSAVIGLTGEARGAVVISMKNDLAIKITNTLTGAAHESLDEEVLDAIGEIVNIVAGNVKRELEESFRLVISLPTIVRGKEHSIKWPHSHTRVICIPFTVSGVDTFHLSVAIEAVNTV
jgi:chemotaxis protein CheX